MSVRAHRIKSIVYEWPSFNLWYDTRIMEALDDRNLLNQLNEDLVGILEVPVEVMKEILEQHWDEIDPDTYQAISEDIKKTTEKGAYYIMYHCF